MSQITVRPAKDADPVEFEVDIPEVDEEDPQSFIQWAKENLREEGDDEDEGILVLVANARASMVVGAQSYARNRYTKYQEGKITEDEMRQSVLDWKPTGRRPAKSAVEKGIDLFDSMSPEQREAFLQKLQAQAE